MDELAKDEKDLEERANFCMRQAKKQGRNQVVG
jgi:PleD family two-component response regulator